MDLFALTRRLVDIESISGNEKDAALFLEDYLRKLGAQVELEEAEPNRPNVMACWGEPDVVLSTHIDTVPPFFPSREDDEFIHGRGSCDAKGIAAAQIEAAQRLAAEGVHDEHGRHARQRLLTSWVDLGHADGIRCGERLCELGIEVERPREEMRLEEDVQACAV